jgi:organic radical activating enzyme
MTKILPNKLLVAERFLSIQGEGRSSGVPSYFIRLSNCNINCGSSIKFLNSIKKGEIIPDPNEPFVGDLELNGSATWSCDTTAVWLKGDYVEFQDLIDDWKREGIYDDICSGLIHIIWTGGEPTIKQHQESISNFIKFWEEYHWNLCEFDSEFGTDDSIGNICDFVEVFHPFREIETNGTIYVENNLNRILNQINCSPKLSNSGMTEKQRIVPEAIQRIMEHRNYQFKFVISNEDDIFEMFETFIKPFNIPLKNVVCMPALTSQEDFFERTRWCMEMAIKYRFIGLTRLHVAAWDSLTGV